MADKEQTFGQAYGTLKSCADKLKNLPVDSFDDLLPIVDQATAAYAVCRSRIEAVKKLLEERKLSD